VGTVLAVGEGVTAPAPGDRVAGSGGHASHVTVRADRCYPVPDGLAPERAVFHSLAAIALQGVRKSRVELGESAASLGLGMVGNLAMQLARLQGAVPTVGLDLDPWRREVAQASGADLCLDPTDAGQLEQLTTATGGGPTVVLESTGFADAVNTAFQIAGQFGRVVLLASTRGVTETNFYRDVHRKGLVVYGAHNAIRPQRESSAGFWTLADDARTVLRLLQAGRLVTEPITSKIFPATDAPTAYEWLGSWRKDILGMLLDWR
jgi:threonine dehydrogenase-like Zn-dependent dehydrogenase